MFHEFKSKVSHLESDFNKFVATCLISSQVCQYFENFLNMVKLLKQLILADRSGDWKTQITSSTEYSTYFSCVRQYKLPAIWVTLFRKYEKTTSNPPRNI